MCTKCKGDERFVQLNLNPGINMPGINLNNPNITALPDNAAVTSPVKCSSCQKKFEGCSKCGTFGDACTGCYQTHTLYKPTVTPPAVAVESCYRCDYFMMDCLLCYDSESCKVEKPRRQLN